MARTGNVTLEVNYDATVFLVAGLVFVLSLLAIVSTSGYIHLLGVINSPSILNPPIKFLVGSVSYNTSGMAQVPLNQTFCPENATIRRNAAASSRIVYYTQTSVGQTFRYSLIYNNSARQFAYAVVLPPFKLVYFSDAAQTRPDCAGYPNALGNATMIVQAPNSSFVGSFYGILYFNKK